MRLEKKKIIKAKEKDVCSRAHALFFYIDGEEP